MGSHSQSYRSNCVSETAKPLSLNHSTLKKRKYSKMSVIEFSCSLETVPGPKSVISLFRDHDNQQNEETNDEYLMTIQAEVPIQDEKDAKTPEAEFIVVVDRSGSMGGTPWAQVQQALVQMIRMTKQDGNIKMRALAYNSDTTEVQLTGDEETDKRTIQGFRASGSTSFVSTFNRLGEIFSDEKQNPSKTYFVFFMTDGNDTCSNARQIMAEKEKLQTQIEKFGAQVIFHAIGFSEDHDEAFLESLTYIGTSDGSYSFVSPSEGDRALEEILLALVKTTSSVVGKCTNIEITSENIDFLGNNFLETTNNIVLPATMTKGEGKIKMITKKFMRLRKDQEPKMQLKVHEDLTGKSEGREGFVQNYEIQILEKEEDIADHNLKKLRTAMNMVMAKISDANDDNEKEKMKVWFELLSKNFKSLKIDEKNAPKPTVTRKKAVESGLHICKEIYDPTYGNLSNNERRMKAMGAYDAYNMYTAQSTNVNFKQGKLKSKSSNMWTAGSKLSERSELTSKTRFRDMSDEEEEEEEWDKCDVETTATQPKPKSK